VNRRITSRAAERPFRGMPRPQRSRAGPPSLSHHRQDNALPAVAGYRRRTAQGIPSAHPCTRWNSAAAAQPTQSPQGGAGVSLRINFARWLRTRMACRSRHCAARLGRRPRSPMAAFNRGASRRTHAPTAIWIVRPRDITSRFDAIISCERLLEPQCPRFPYINTNGYHRFLSLDHRHEHFHTSGESCIDLSLCSLEPKT